MLRRSGVDRAVAVARAVAPRRPPQDPRRLARAVERVLAPLPTDTRCLITSLVLLRVVSRRGGDASVVIAARAPSEFAAHAWVEVDGRAVLDPGDERYTRLVEL